MESPVGLRERKKEATRQAVHEATLRLAIEHGFDHVTVEAVADAAGISRRTFSNYFTGKEDALLYGEEKQVRELVRAMRDRPAEETAWTALRAAVAQFTERVAPPEREWALRTRLAMRHPSLLARQLANHAALERDLADAVAVRRARRRDRSARRSWPRRSSPRCGSPCACGSRRTWPASPPR